MLTVYYLLYKLLITCLLIKFVNINPIGISHKCKQSGSASTTECNSPVRDINKNKQTTTKGARSVFTVYTEYSHEN